MPLRGVRYAGEAKPIFIRACHGKACQPFTGTVFATIVSAPKGTVVFRGSLKTCKQLGGTLELPLHRRFCPDCGTAIIV
jgi:hypothetical protein